MLTFTARPRLARSFGALATAAVLAASTVVVAPAAAAQPTAHAAKAGKKKAPSKTSKTKAKNKKTKAKAKSKSKAKRADNAGLLATWTGTPAAGTHAGKSVAEHWAFGGKLFNIARTASTNDTMSIWGPLVDDGTTGAAVPGPGRSSDLKEVSGGYCFESAQWDAVWRAQRSYATKFRESVELIEQLRTDAAARAALPAGPEVGGLPTVTAKLDVWPTVERTPATVAFDAASGAVKRITPTLTPEYLVDITSWNVNASPTDAALLKVAGDPERNATTFVNGPCKG